MLFENVAVKYLSFSSILEKRATLRKKKLLKLEEEIASLTIKNLK